MDNKILSVGEAGSLLMGAGLTKLDDYTGLALIVFGVVLKITVAVLKQKGYDVSATG